MHRLDVVYVVSFFLALVAYFYHGLGFGIYFCCGAYDDGCGVLSLFLALVSYFLLWPRVFGLICAVVRTMMAVVCSVL